MWRSFPVTAAGPFLIFTGFPINCTHSNLNGTNNMLNNLKCQEKNQPSCSGCCFYMILTLKESGYENIPVQNIHVIEAGFKGKQYRQYGGKKFCIKNGKHDCYLVFDGHKGN